MPEIIPVSPERAILPLKSNPAGSAGIIDHVPDSIPVKLGIIMKSDWLITASKTSDSTPSLAYPRILVSIASQIPSSSPSSGMLDASLELVPHSASSSSDHRSLSSSGSAVKLVSIPSAMSSGMPSPSKSSDAAESLGNASGPATQMLAFGVDGPSHTPSPSVSGLLVLVELPSAFISSSFGIPSPSISSSSASHVASPSVSEGVTL